MTATSRLISLVALPGIVLAATLARSADLLPARVSSLNGTLHVQQGVPCGDDVDFRTPVTGGYLELAPAEGLPAAGGNRVWSLTQGVITFAGFSVTRSCLGFSQTLVYGPIHVQINRPVRFTATPTPTPNLYDVVIPRADFQLSYITTRNGETEAATKFPQEDVTGSIDLATGAVQMRLVLGTRVHFQLGCVQGDCAIDETKTGTFIANLNGTMVFPDADRDGVPDRSDNCRYTPNPSQDAVTTPTIVAPPAITLASCSSRHIGLATGSDICDGRPVIVASDAPPQFDIGVNLVHWRAIDSMKREATASQTVTVVDTTPPVVTCNATRPTGSSFRVHAEDSCLGASVIRLGPYVLNDNEVILINETGRPGIRLLESLAAGRIRHFQVGKGEAVVSATDASNNVASVACPVPGSSAMRTASSRSSHGSRSRR